MAYFKLEYYSDCAVGEIPANYHFFYWIDAQIGEPHEDYLEEGEEDGYKKFIPTFKKSVKKYFMETGEIPEYLIDAINRMKMFNHVSVTNSLNETWSMYNIKTEITYPFPNKCYGIMKIEFDIDETVVVTGCC